MMVEATEPEYFLLCCVCIDYLATEPLPQTRGLEGPLGIQAWAGRSGWREALASYRPSWAKIT